MLKLKNKKEVLGFLLEVTLFVTTGYLFAKGYKFLSLFFLGCALHVAFYVGEMIHKRGVKTNGNR